MRYSALPLLSLCTAFAFLACLEIGKGKAPARTAGDVGVGSASAMTAIACLGIAVLTGVFLLVRHAPYVSSDERANEFAMGVSLGDLRAADRVSAIRSLEQQAGDRDLRIGIASPGTLRGVGPNDPIWINCGNCYLGGLPLPVRTVRAEVYSVAQDTFVHLGVSVDEGRDFQRDLDTGGILKVAIVSRSLANQHFESGDAIGRTLRFGDSRLLTVVGIASNRAEARSGTDYAVYVPIGQAAPTELEVLGDTRTLGAVPELLPAEATTGLVRSSTDTFAVHHWFDGLLRMVGLVGAFLVGFGAWVSGRSEARAVSYEVALRKALGAKSKQLWIFFALNLGHRLGIALLGGFWISLFLGAALNAAYGGIPQIDVVASTQASFLVGLGMLLGSLPQYARAIREEPVQSLGAAAWH